VDSERHGLFHSMMQRFYKLTGCPVIINTSFNVRGEPIVCTPQDAYCCFTHTHIDVLVLGNHLVTKKDGVAEPKNSVAYLSQFQLD
jgi:carbamoyltransferase